MLKSRGRICNSKKSGENQIHFRKLEREDEKMSAKEFTLILRALTFVYEEDGKRLFEKLIIALNA